MVEVPQVGSSGIKLSTISDEEKQEFSDVVQKLENYSQDIIRSFDETIKGIRGNLDGMGDVAIKAIAALEEARAKIQSLSEQSYEELDQIINSVESVITELECIDTIQADVNFLSDAITTVETAVRSKSA
ncbi:hypothetical protein TVAG_392710 [Trichomonas vaginalis G3]|uniref:Uncharacterized protein n=1 Tax=Trichomonas vaginalis (strain ATCC PRA-98 / G3) TaxID=412133 RepID=A2DWX2_TRIV3|nr:hypothetical protein TVAGG3_0839120 [Trichomonas vaginalis G3]EAY15154.1 hypothetical protein TVAG_392710 [Trichomonas vaginalis G3]KAI5499155.1 hypothetical protein TVAGG3_0839120 [Trichomonas vaginalis G3]|eukprot:XP_001327377.1 hypothetical protein [Trichomonas vaginalis G3]